MTAIAAAGPAAASTLLARTTSFARLAATAQLASGWYW
jgi:hypothetical protein